MDVVTAKAFTRLSRALKGQRVYPAMEEPDVEVGEPEKEVEKQPLVREKPVIRERPSLASRHQSLISGVSYCVASCSMILLNKVVLSGYEFNAGISLMFYQNLVSVLVVYFLSATGVITTEPITWRLVKVWFPVNFLFVGMLVTSIFSLRLMNVAMVTILKNVTNLITAVGEIYFFGKRHNSRVWLSLILMVVSAFSGGVTDLSFQRHGYAWQVVNCFCTAAYSVSSLYALMREIWDRRYAFLSIDRLLPWTHQLSLLCGTVFVFLNTYVRFRGLVAAISLLR